MLLAGAQPPTDNIAPESLAPCFVGIREGASSILKRWTPMGMGNRFESEFRGAGARDPGAGMTAPDVDAWFTREVLPLETALMQYLQHNWRNQSDIADLRQEVYVRVLESASQKVPDRPKQFVFATARNLLIDRVRREHIVPIEAAEDVGALEIALDEPGPDRSVLAREELRRLQ